MIFCPNKKSKDYKDVVEKVGERNAFLLWNKNEGKIRAIKAEASKIANDNLPYEFQIKSHDTSTIPQHSQREAFQSYVDNHLAPVVTRLSVGGNDLRSILKRASRENLDAESRALIDKFLPVVSNSIKVNFDGHTNQGAENGRYSNFDRSIDVYHKNLTLKYGENAPEALFRTLIHEAAHSVLSGRANLFLKGRTDLLSAEDAANLKELKSHYDELKPKAQDYYGFSTFPEFLEQVVNNPKMVDSIEDIQKGFFPRVWNTIMKFFKGVLGLDEALSTKLNKTISSLLLTYNEAHENSIKDYLKDTYDYSLTATPISDISEIKQRAFTHEDGINEEERMISRYFRDLNTPGEIAFDTRKVILPTGKEVDFTGIATDEGIREKLRTEIKTILDLEKNTSSNFANWINSGGLVSGFRDHFPVSEYREDYYRKVAAGIASGHLGFNPATDKALLYNSQESKDLGLFVPGFEGNNPVVIVHGADKGVSRISLVDMTYDDISTRSNKNLFHFASPKIKEGKEAYQFPFENTSLGYRKFCLTAQIMAMKEKNPDLQVKRAFVGQLEAKIRGDKGSAVPFKTSYIEMNNQLAEVKRLVTNKEFVSSLGEIGKTISNSALHDPSIYQMSYLHFLENHYKGAIEMVNKHIDYDGVSIWNYGKQESGSLSANQLGIMEQGVHSLVEDPVKNKKWLDTLKARLNWIEMHNQREELSEEVKLLSGAIIEVKNRMHKGLGVIKDAQNFTDVHLTSPQNWRHPLMQTFRRTIETSFFKINESFNKWHDEMVGTSEKPGPFQIFNKYLHVKDPSLFGKELIKDVSKQRFEAVFKKRDFSTESGNTVRRTVWELHTDKNDIETKEAIARGETTLAEVEFGKALNDSFKKQVLINLEEEIVRKKSGSFMGVITDESYDKYRAEAKEEAEAQLKSWWKEGVMPVFSKTVAESFFGGDFKGGMNKLMNQLSDPNEIFNDWSKESDWRKDFVSVNNLMNQVMDPTSPQYGRGERMTLLGLKRGADGKLYAEEKDPELGSYDLELMSKYFHMMSLRTNEFNRNVLPEANATKALLETYQNDPSVLKNWQKALDLYVKRVVHGESQKLYIDPNDTSKVNLDKNISLAMRVMPFINLSWSIPTGIAAFIQNYASLATTTLAHTVSGANLYHASDVARAFKEFSLNPNKSRALLKFYQLADVSADDLVHGTRKGYHTEFQKHLFSSHSFQILNWMPDYTVKQVTYLAQMIKDGSYDAHTFENGVLKYDSSKDTRFQGPHGAELKSFYLKNLKEQNLLPEDATEIDRAYDVQGINAIKDIAAMKITGGYEQLQQPNVGYSILGRGFKTYRLWAFNKWTSLYQHGFERDASGTPVYNEKTGEYEYSTEYFEGKIQSIMRSAKLVKEALAEGDVSVFTKGIKAMPGKSKQNIAQLAADTTLAMAAYFLFRGLTDDDDKDLDNDTIAKFGHTKFGKAMAFGFYDLVAEWQPQQLARSLSSPFAVLPYLKNCIDFGTALITFDANKAATGAKRVLPLGQTIAGVEELFKESK